MRRNAAQSLRLPHAVTFLRKVLCARWIVYKLEGVERSNSISHEHTYKINPDWDRLLRMHVCEMFRSRASDKACEHNKPVTFKTNKVITYIPIRIYTNKRLLLLVAIEIHHPDLDYVIHPKTT